MPLQGSTQEALGRNQIAPLAEPELNGVAVVIDRAIEIPPLASDPDVGLVDMPLSGGGSLTRIEPLQQFR